MPKTPPLLLPTGPTFSAIEDGPSFRSLLSPLLPNDYPIIESHTLDTVMEEGNDTSMIEDKINEVLDEDQGPMASSQPNDGLSQHNSLPTVSAAPETAQNTFDYYLSTNDDPYSWQSPSTHATKDERAPDTQQNLNLAYDNVLIKHQNLKTCIDSLMSTLSESEADQRDAIQDLQTYKEHLQERGAKLRERWLQTQVHAEELLQPQNYSDDTSSQ